MLPQPLPRPCPRASAAPASALILEEALRDYDWREPGTILAMVAPLTAVAHLSRSW